MRRLRFWRIESDEYERMTFPPGVGYGQVEGFFGWIPPILVAPFVGVVTAVIAGNLWLLPVVTLLGSVLGIVAGLGGWLAIVSIDKYWLRLGPPIMYVAGIVLWVGGPAIAVLVGVLFVLHAEDLRLPLWSVGLFGAVFAVLWWWFFRWHRMEPAPSVAVPDLRGLTLPEAHRLAGSLGLHISCAPITPRRIGNEVVATQVPGPDEVVSGDSLIRVTATPPPAAVDPGR